MNSVVSKTRAQRSGNWKQRVLALASLVVMIIFFTILKPVFLNFENIMSIFLATCVNGVLALGVTFVIITGGIDLSVGTVMTFSSVIGALAISTWHIPVIPGILMTLAAGTLCGFISGFGVAKMNLPPFMATLAMMNITKGLSLVLTGAKPIYFTSVPGYRQIALGSIFGVNSLFNAIFIYVIVIVIAVVILSKTVLGRYCYSLGSNEEAVRLSGVRVDRWKIAIYSLCGCFCAIAGVLMSSRLDSAQPALGPGYEFEAITAAVIGGTSLSGGEGSMIGTVIGAFIMSVLINGLRILSVPQEWQSVVMGLVLALAVYYDLMRRKKS